MSGLLCALILASSAPARAQDTAGSNTGRQSFPAMMNPAISANGLFLAGMQMNDGSFVGRPPGEGEEDPNELAGQGEAFGTGLALQELEVQLQSVVDPYFKANLILALPGGEGIEAEEAYVTLTSIPRLLINIGKFKQPFGRENLAHTHALLKIDKSLVGQRMLGGEGLNDMGINVALLLPTPWFSELTVGADAGNNEVLYGNGGPAGLGTMAHWKNLLDLSQDTSMELGFSGATGLDAFDGRSVIGGADFTLRSHGRSRHQWNRMLWQSEFMWMQRENAPEDEALGGFYTTFEYSFSRRIWLGGSYDYVGLGSTEEPSMAATLIAIFAPTEFSALRVSGERQFLPGDHTIDSVVAQLNFTIGNHPAHSY